MANLKKMVLGEEMPDKDDPKYKTRYEKDVEAGRKFARVTRFDKLMGHVQAFATKHGKLFLVIVFGFVIGCLAMNVFRMAKAYGNRNADATVTESIEEYYKQKLEKNNETTITDYGLPEEN